MRQKFLFCVLCFAGIFFFQDRLDAYSTYVHQRITKKTIDENVDRLNKYAIDYAGAIKGMDGFVNGKRLREWIEDGSVKEDYNWNSLFDPLYSHFYEPITNTSGVGSLSPSAYDWANDSSNEWSWQNARIRFYSGLTLSTETEREEALADAFYAIGHVIHLVEDMAMPAHTRADLHASIFPVSLIVGKDNYETYTDTNIDKLNYTLLPFPYWNVSVSSGAPRQLWDLDSYNGSTVYASGPIGLSEYTNPNPSANSQP